MSSLLTILKLSDSIGLPNPCAERVAFGAGRPTLSRLSSYKVFYWTAFLRAPAFRLWKDTRSDEFNKKWIR